MKTFTTNELKTYGKGMRQMKRVAPLALSVLLLGAMNVNADETQNPVVTSQTEEQAPTFVQVAGKISSSETLTNGLIRFYNDDEENPFSFTLKDSTLVFDKKGNEVELKEGDVVTLYMPSNQPMIMIYPPQYSPAVVIVGEDAEPNFVKVTQFDENFLSEDQQLKLNIGEDTVIVNSDGEEVDKAEVYKQRAIVFYNMTTRSIPAQTTPSKIVVFTDEMAKLAKLDAIIGEDIYEVQGKQMVPLRKIAEGFGYKVEATKNGAILSKGPVTYTLTRGQKMYGYNKALGYFEVAPELLEYGKTYVEYEFALELIK